MPYHSFLRNVILFLFAIVFHTNSYGQCPDNALLIANGKCVSISWDTPPNPLEGSIEYDSNTFDFYEGSGTLASPAIYKDPTKANCNGGSSSYSGNLTVDGLTCVYENGGFQGTLAIEFSRFEIKNESGNIEVVAEVYSDSKTWFTIQHSFNGIQWENLSNLNEEAFLGFKNLNYKTSLSTNGKQYFRISSVDENGVKNYSEIKSIIIQNGADYQVFPVPVEDFLFISNTIQIQSIEIFDQIGRSQKTISSPFENGIDFSGFESGVYFIRIMNERGGVFQRTVIK